MNKSLKFVLIIFFVIIIPLIVLALFYMDVQAEGITDAKSLNEQVK